VPVVPTYVRRTRVKDICRGYTYSLVAVTLRRWWLRLVSAWITPVHAWTIASFILRKPGISTRRLFFLFILKQPPSMHQNRAYLKLLYLHAPLPLADLQRAKASMPRIIHRRGLAYPWATPWSWTQGGAVWFRAPGKFDTSQRSQAFDFERLGLGSVINKII
jgi:hypothetical protein